MKWCFLIIWESHEFSCATSSPPTCNDSCYWQLIVFAYLVWPGLSTQMCPNVIPLQEKFFWNHLPAQMSRTTNDTNCFFLLLRDPEFRIPRPAAVSLPGAAQLRRRVPGPPKAKTGPHCSGDQQGGFNYCIKIPRRMKKRWTFETSKAILKSEKNWFEI